MIMSTIMMLFIMWILIMAIAMLNFLISKSSTTKMNKISPFECGFNNLSKTQPPFSLNFYLMTILFLMFDIEITMIMPFFILYKTSNMLLIMLTFYFFIYIMIVALMYEWKQSILNWKM
uniref:NADH-ubiquinone oxidoreductase chain 3 n=1 Tax=Plectrocnemia tsukuiensis TaxID=623670 RepID=A0A9E8RT11_9NEOP|nr:NADH dehydrogenase subunit 3 [Plectrocnemia tsukuiensis]UZZ43694.1 NADH dehydrogenase subunit 3 [Plectrocnemia tsukuiensis]